MKDIGKNIRRIRQEKGMTQETMAEALFVTRQTVSNYENGRSRPDLDMLLRISEILGTDLNTIIYGPPIPQSKKENYKWLAISAGILLGITVLYVTLAVLFPRATGYGYKRSIWQINKTAVLPVVMFVLGWFLTHCVGTFGNLRQLRPEKNKALRISVLIALGLIAVIPVPYMIFFAVAGYRSWVYHSVSMTFPYIPIYEEAYRVLAYAIYQAPFVYMILGSLAWRLGLPLVKTKAGDAAAGET